MASRSASDGYQSEFNCSDKGSREHDNAHVSTKPLINHLGSSEKNRRFPVSRAWFDREPDICEGESATGSGEVTTKQDLFLEILGGAAEDTKNSSLESGQRWSQRIGRDTVPSDECREAGPSEDAVGALGLEVDDTSAAATRRR